jgi:hypothetical protein
MVYAATSITKMANNNSALTKANKAKKDEFYTQLADIENELQHYKEHFSGKTVLCNCDDPRVSNFFHYFSYKFEDLGLKRLITTCYKNQERDFFSKNECDQAVYLEYEGDKNGNHIPDAEEIGVKPLKGDGDFRSAECIELLKQADIVVTNPPFSLFREYVAQLIGTLDKKFLIIGNLNAITYKDCFQLIKNRQDMDGRQLHRATANLAYPKITRYAAGSRMTRTATNIVKFRNCAWFTNLDIPKRHENLILYKKYKPDEFPKYDNYDAINVDKTADIPCDYDGAMGVPITFLDKYNPEQFEMLDANDYRTNDKVPIKPHGLIKDKDGAINGKNKYARILIRRKH